MEVTKWLKPKISVSRIGDSASVQAGTRVNAEQASKRTMRGNERSTPSRCAGVVATACTQGKRTQHGRPHDVVRDDQPDAREGQAGRRGDAEGFVALVKPGKRPGEGRDLSSRRT